MPDLPFDDALRHLLAVHFGSFAHRELRPTDKRQAAVAIVIVADNEDQAAILLTRRASGLRRHGGQWALPGGCLDSDEEPLDAALRELDEEVGLTLRATALLGRLDDYATRSGFLISPLVFWGPRRYHLRRDPSEVSAIYSVPLTDLGRDDALIRTPWDETHLPTLALHSLGELVFCPTAAILHQFAELAVHGRIIRVADFAEPRFAWR